MGLPEILVPGRTEPAPRFTDTRWTLVLAAAGADPAGARDAMARILETYWYPLYAFVRRKGHDPEDACDLTQEFLSRLLERNLVSEADPAKGRFRTFLLAALERFLVDEWRRRRRKKRGGGRFQLSLSLLEAENRYRLEPADTMTPERIYARRWAITLLERALGRLERECIAADRTEVFAAVRPILAGEQPCRPYAVIASELRTTEGALKTLMCRMRRRFGTLLRAEIAQTVSDPQDVEEEIQSLFHVLR